MAASQNSLRLLLDMIEPTRHEGVVKPPPPSPSATSTTSPIASRKAKLQDLQDECDSLLRIRKRLVTRNVGLWNVLSTTSSNNGNYNWAARTLDENERQIKDIDKRLEQIKLIEEKEKGSL